MVHNANTMNDNLTNKIAKFVKNKRFALALSQREFALLIFGDERKRQWISSIELGRPITVTTLGLILSKLDAQVDIIEF